MSAPLSPAGRAVAGGIAYFAVVFGIGFMLGVFRVLAIEPRMGSTVSVAFELPLMLLVSWLAARRLVVVFEVTPSLRARLVMAVIGLVLLVAAESALGRIFGQSLGEQFSSYGTMRGALTLVGQLGFAAMPLLVRWPQSAG